VNLVRVKTENVSQNESVQSCHHGANLSLPTITSPLSKGKGNSPHACMQCNIMYVCFIPKLPSLFIYSAWLIGQQIMDYKRIESRNVVLPIIIIIIIYTVKYNKFLEIVQNTPTDIL